MKNTVWMLTAACALGILVGCGDKTSQPDASPAADAKQPAGPSADQSAVPAPATEALGTVALVTVNAATPEEAVTSFLGALQTGDEKSAAALLTTKAREETATHDMVVEPPGAPNATYTVGRVQHPDDNPDAAYVSCVWAEKYENGEDESYEVVWVMRRETAGWRVAGMATQLSEAEEPVFLDFEDLAAMETAVQQAEAGRSAAASSAAAPSAETDNTLR